MQPQQASPSRYDREFRCLRTRAEFRHAGRAVLIAQLKSTIAAEAGDTGTAAVSGT
jgi:hypothetical protein